jgi:predicted SAM-dependent methyltransferase
MIKLNIGGGAHWSMDGWENLDRAQSGYDISKLWLSNFENDSVDLLYSSHNIEHFSWELIPKYVSEIYRVLKPGGTIRFCVPDLDVLWKMLRDNDKSPVLHNTNYYVGEKATRPVLMDVRELFGWDADLNSERFLKGTMHNAFFSKSILGIFLYNAGFNNMMEKKGVNDSDIDDFKVAAVFNAQKHFLSGFDNTPLEPISFYVESTK